MLQQAGKVTERQPHHIRITALHSCNRMKSFVLDGIAAGFISVIAALDIAFDFCIGISAHKNLRMANVLQEEPSAFLA